MLEVILFMGNNSDIKDDYEKICRGLYNAYEKVREMINKSEFEFAGFMMDNVIVALKECSLNFKDNPFYEKSLTRADILRGKLGTLPVKNLGEAVEIFDYNLRSMFKKSKKST